MPIEDFIARTVSPGEPLTAQAWNEVVEALDELNDHVISTETASLRVQVTNPSATGARVTAVAESGDMAYEAVRPIAPDTHHRFAGLRPGVYTVRGEAPGFDPTTEVVTVPTGGVVELTLSPRGVRMPALFGRSLQEALAELRNAGIAVDRVLDVVGRDIAPANPAAEHLQAPVLIQVPQPGIPVPPEGRAALAVAAALRVEPTVEVPSLVGLSLSEAKTALESLGLSLGNVETRQLTES